MKYRKPGHRLDLSLVKERSCECWCFDCLIHGWIACGNYSEKCTRNLTPMSMMKNSKGAHYYWLYTTKKSVKDKDVLLKHQAEFWGTGIFSNKYREDPIPFSGMKFVDSPIEYK